MPIMLNRTLKRIPPSGIRAFFDLVLTMDDVVSLGVGEPDFASPWNVCEAAIHSIEQGYTSYTSNKGMAELRREIARHLKKGYRLQYDPETEILVTVGVSEALDIALRALLNPGDKVLVPEPCFVCYSPLVELAGGETVYVPTSKDSAFKLSPRQLEPYVDDKVKAIIFNYPSNPTGASYSKKELSAIAKFLVQHDIVVLSDEIYADLTYEYEHTPFPVFPKAKANTIYMNGFSKAYAMTGWRIGYACGPKEIIDAMAKIHQYAIMCSPIMGQIAAVEALKHSAKDVQSMKREYHRRRDYIVTRLNQMGLDCHLPEGAFYVFPSIEKTGLSDVAFCRQLLEREHVAVVPGSAFGPSGSKHIRLSYASSLSKIKEAMDRIERFLL